MHSLANENAPKAAATAKGAGIACIGATATSKAYASQVRSRKRMYGHAIGPKGEFIVWGQTAKALRELVARGDAGVTALEVNSWAYRLGAYVHDLRHIHGLTIETVRELHDGGWHARYVLRSPVLLTEVEQ